jgi:predicted small secreted protein
LIVLWLLAAVIGAGHHSGPSAVAAEPATKRQANAALASARERAETAHVIYAATLEMLHRHYFRRGQAVLPAKGLEEVFAEVADQTKVAGSWIAVNTKPMSVHHTPKTDFEKRAAAAIAAGQERFEELDADTLRIARPIPLGEGCVSCHDGMFRSRSKSPLVAGLIVAVPLK